ncbi:hypothetical protein QYF36_013072 [Acer negundo]|nr:hypothetical protein QYF36_013072 [Acer negundo]
MKSDSVVLVLSHHWQAPRLRVFKINTDVVIHSANATSGVGVVLRDNDGVQLASAKGFLLAVLESDALNVVNTINGEEVPNSDVGVVIHDILC